MIVIDNRLHKIRIFHHHDVHIRAAVADNPNTPYSSLLKLARDQTQDIRYQLAENHNVPVQVIFILAYELSLYLRLKVN